MPVVDVSGTLVTVKEIRRSRGHVSSTNPTARREFMAWGTGDGGIVETAVDTVAPTTVSGIPINSVKIDPKDEEETVWDCVYEYSTESKNEREVPETDDEEISFELGSQTINVTQSFDTTSYPKSGETAPDFKGGIGYDGETFTGIDQMIETFSFSITKYVAAATVEDSSYIASLRNCAFKTNDDTFRGFVAGEVMFIGASGSKRSADDYAVTFKFMVGKNATALTIGDVEDIDKNAWDYLWVLYEEVEDEVADFTVKQPKAAYVEHLYTDADFPTLLGLSA